jgi:arylsulfatase A-like enzyme
LNVVLVIIDSLRKDHVGTYGSDWIKTPNLDRLAGESLVFERALPESIPTINARRAIHTGTRCWPFKDWVVPKGEDIRLQGWQPIPEGQTTLAQVLKEHGYRSMLVTDTMHQFKPSYNMHEGFDAFDFIRGQNTDNYQPNWTFPREKVDRALLDGNVEVMRAQMQQYRANIAGTNLGTRGGEEDYLSPRVFTRASEYPAPRKRRQRTLFHGGGFLRPPRALGHSGRVRAHVRRRSLRGEGALLRHLRPERLPR